MLVLDSNCDLGLLTPLVIKVLDLQTRRYHAGVVHAASDGSLEVELSGSSQLKAGSAIRYSLGDTPFVAARAMRNAVVKQVARIDSHLRVALAVELHCAAA